jgi:hypothetical protein
MATARSTEADKGSAVKELQELKKVWQEAGVCVYMCVYVCVCVCVSPSLPVSPSLIHTLSNHHSLTHAGAEKPGLMLRIRNLQTFLRQEKAAREQLEVRLLLKYRVQVLGQISGSIGFRLGRTRRN